jgi:hypothetical protein
MDVVKEIELLKYQNKLLQAIVFCKQKVQSIAAKNT